MVFCKKCGAQLQENDIFCYFCGATVEKTKSNNEVDKHYESTSISNDNLIKTYVRENVDKIKAGKFSFPTLFLGPIYFIYRKMTLAAILWIILNVVAIFIPYGTLLMLLANIILAIKFNEFYLETVGNRVEKIKEQNQDKSSDEILNIVKKKGGVSIAGIVITVFLLTFIITTVFVYFATVSTTSYIKHEFDNTMKEMQKDDYFDYTIPKEFKAGTISDYYKRYSFYGDNSYCSINIQNSSSRLYDDTTEYLKHRVYVSGTDKVSEITQKDINGELWLHQTVETSYSKKYYYAIENKDRYHVIIYEINRDKDNFCSKSHEKFLSSLKLKNNTLMANDL
mgnify:CR=1 FL=1